MQLLFFALAAIAFSGSSKAAREEAKNDSAVPDPVKPSNDVTEPESEPTQTPRSDEKHLAWKQIEDVERDFDAVDDDMMKQMQSERKSIQNFRDAKANLENAKKNVQDAEDLKKHHAEPSVWNEFEDLIEDEADKLDEKVDIAKSAEKRAISKFERTQTALKNEQAKTTEYFEKADALAKKANKNVEKAKKEVEEAKQFSHEDLTQAVKDAKQKKKELEEHQKKNPPAGSTPQERQADAKIQSEKEEKEEAELREAAKRVEEAELREAAKRNEEDMALTDANRKLKKAVEIEKKIAQNMKVNQAEKEKMTQWVKQIEAGPKNEKNESEPFTWSPKKTFNEKKIYLRK